MKKGFTLVELAIVLVVIGMIVGFAIKGKSLIDSARMKSEINKIVKLETAVALYMAANNGKNLMGAGAGSNANQQAFVDMDMLIDLDYISKKDTMSFYKNSQWIITQCLAGSNSSGGYLYTNSGGKPVVGNLCAFLSGGITSNVVCNIERILDDDNVKGGTGRRWAGALNSSDDNITQMIANGCVKVTTAPYNYGYLMY